ncbi:hypothetical protein E8E12_010497 [Didymella heteroderae]|uniref:Myb-like domain-containing protein n=1 Tax=Didymella heteroderae TaxID=1769908 RepID=A0A9P4WWQ6_9PLEO|nr:hypothetical protein E8E12_010497 [Didymella heteroderae]
MADASGAPRRVSMAYILGFSNRPFKDGGPPAAPPVPRHPSAFKQMVTTPGGVIEWAASDGRRGRLTGPGKPRLTAATLAQVPDGKAPSIKAASKKVAEVDEGGLFGSGLFDNPPAAPAASVKGANDDQPDISDCNKEQDEKLMELKGENKTWADIATALDKKEHECKGRFTQIKPKDWKPNTAKGGGSGKSNHHKQKRQKNSQGDDKKGEDKKDGATDANAWPGDSGVNSIGWENNTGGDSGNNDSKEWDISGGGGGGGSGWDVSGDNNGGDNQDSGSFNNDNNKGWDTGGGGGGGGWDTSADKNDSSGFKDDSGCLNNDTTNGWDTGGGGSGNNGLDGWDINNNGGSGDGWDAPTNDVSKDNVSKKGSSNKGSSSNKDAKESSNKTTSQSGSKHHFTRGSEKSSSTAPKAYELKPDSTFSADDLRLIAKILQQDCSMVWNRVSWRFQDKTGRNLHPDVFEKKITGKTEDRGSERGRR